jgi:HK97 family phage portal protein
MQITAVAGSTGLISESLATLPIKQYRLVNGDAVQMEPAPVIQQPWPELTRRDFVIQGSMSMLLRGNLWGRIASRDDRLNPLTVQLVHPDNARVRRLTTAQNGIPAGGLEFRYWNKVVSEDDVTRARALSFPEMLEGLNPIEYLRLTFGTALAMDLYNSAFFSNSAHPGGVIEVDEDLDEEATQDLAASWNAAHQGIGHAHLPAVLTGGAKWQQITLSLADAQFLQQLGWSASQISGMIYRVPPHMLGMVDKDTSWGSGIEQQELGFVRNTLLIWLCRWEDLMRAWLPKGQFVTFDLSERLRGDTLQRWSAWQIARVTGAMNNAEIRAAEGLPAITDPAQAAVLNDFAAPLNSAPMKPGNGGAGGDKAN